MHTNRQTFWNNTPASAAHLGCVGRVHGDNWDTGTFSLVFKHLSEQSNGSRMSRRAGRGRLYPHVGPHITAA